MVTLYVADISSLPDPLVCQELMQQIPPERQSRIRNMKQEKNRKQSMGAGLLLQKVLALYHMADERVIEGPHGKPRVDGLEFNLSHSGNLVICAVSDELVGCDVEKIRKAPRDVVSRYFSECEQEYLSRFSDREYDKNFFRLWTMKESYVKMTGEGLRVPFDAYEIRFDDSGARVVRDGEVWCCHLSSVEVKDYVIAICANSSTTLEVILDEI